MPPKKTISIFLLLFIPYLLFAGPFGIEMGMTIDQVRSACSLDVVLVENDLYEVFPILKHSAFEKYLVRISSTYGVYFIKAIGVDIKTSRYGEGLISAFNELENSIKKKYGNFERLDYLQAGSYWDQPEYWMMGLLEGERHLMSVWDRDIGSKIPDDTDSIYISAYATRTDLGWVAIEYYSINYDAAKEERVDEEDSVF